MFMFQGLSKLHKSVDAVASNVETLLVQHASRATEALVLALSTLRGFSRGGRAYEKLGLETEALSVTVCWAQLLLVKVRHHTIFIYFLGVRTGT